MIKEYTIKKSTANIFIDDETYNKLHQAKLSRNWKLFNLDEKNMKKWKR